jgi:hypothetical protein
MPSHHASCQCFVGTSSISSTGRTPKSTQSILHGRHVTVIQLPLLRISHRSLTQFLAIACRIQPFASEKTARPPPIMILLVLVFELLQYASATGRVCSSGLYALLAPLKTNAEIQAYCTSSYPVIVTSTITSVSVSVQTQITTVSAPVKRGVKRGPFAAPDPAPATTTTTTRRTPTSANRAGTTSTTMRTSTTQSRNTATQPLISSLKAQAKSVISTFCSCIGTPTSSNGELCFRPTPRQA